MIRLVLSAMGLLLLSCSHAATGSSTPQGPSSQSDCSSDADCRAKDPTEFCDFLFSRARPGSGKCTHACNDGTLICHNAEICNPVSGACETTCAGNSNLCLIQGQTGFCVGKSPQSSYCALEQSAAGVCPSLLKASGGLCKLPCTSSPCSNGQVCDAVTNTCERGCSTTAVSPCSDLSYTPPPNSSGTQPSVQFSCSSVTATCVPGCAPGSCSGFGVRTFCDARSNTCEQSCVTEACNNSGLSCEKFIVATTAPVEQSICVIACDTLGTAPKCPGNLFCQGKGAPGQTCQPPF